MGDPRLSVDNQSTVGEYDAMTKQGDGLLTSAFVRAARSTEGAGLRVRHFIRVRPLVLLTKLDYWYVHAGTSTVCTVCHYLAYV